MEFGKRNSHKYIYSLIPEKHRIKLDCKQMNQTSKLLIMLGIAIVLVGLIWHFFGKHLGWLGNLPGDIRVGGENGGGFYFPIVTCIIISIFASVVLNLFRKFF